MDILVTTNRRLEGAFRMFSTDLEALPEDAFDRHFGGKSRTVADIVHEVVTVNDHIRLTICGEELFDFPDGWITAPERLRTKAAVLASFKESSDKVLASASKFTVEDLEGKVTTEHGETNRLERCNFMAWHTSYHSGQLNFIQTLIGDDGWHWN